MAYLRFSLMLAVAYCHLRSHALTGTIAVLGFYTLSGFLITLVSSEIYNHGLHGRLDFLLNRFLRIYPTYWVCLMIGLACLVLSNDSMALAYWFVPQGTQWLPNIFIYGLAGFRSMLFSPLILPESWSLSVELVYYLVIGLVCGHSRRLTTIGFLAACAYTSVLYLSPALDYHFFELYVRVDASAPVFLLGGMLYHYRDYLRWRITTRWLLILLVNLIVYLPEWCGMHERAKWGWLDDISDPLLMPMACLCAVLLAYCIGCLYHLELGRKPPPHEQFMADISYPMFLLAHPVNLVMMYWMYSHHHIGWGMFFLSMSVAFAISSFIVLEVDWRLKRLRREIRHDAKKMA